MSTVSMTKSGKAKRPFFTTEHEMFRETLQKYLEREAVPHYDQWEKDRLVPRSFWEGLGENGFLCPEVGEEYGGLGLDFGFSSILGEELSRVGAGILGVSTHSNIVVPYIDSFGSEQQRKKFLPKFVTGESIAAIAMTEPGTGSDLANIKTTAVRDGDHYILNGEKTFITNGIHADVVIVACKTDTKIKPAHRGISLLIVERGMPGFSRGKKLDKIGMHSQDTSELIFEDVRVPVENLLGEEGRGFSYLMQKLQQERIVSANNALVAAEDMLELTIDYVTKREAFGAPLSKLQNTQFKIAEIATQVQIGRTFIDTLIVKQINEEEMVTEVSMAKWWITDMAKRISGECMQLHGGYGYMEEYKIARRYRDIPITTVYAGSNEIMKVIIAKQLGL
ncbi:acyl-CoA dehydrogenase [Sporosarcina sp. P37]|uniref:acyl-CoA dehydrogenase family protein n=1 Tax=unclassified Sporosarcina TaxID=2647733 RepID=UPI0009BD32DE|nr:MULTISPECIES: acyl-CoA dehydrogenase family protein [unclassified Sporosarcina]ARD47972.1 acyl-CoA dehydrogenase [Sporosarcina sp. P33]ARK24497.1 acyl-CoA dehydrogenase [Sporosarcina sp. P37]PID18372.1 acyl-CoA dehydrogenase [Sporosarcina sp. P35]